MLRVVSANVTGTAFKKPNLYAGCVGCYGFRPPKGGVTAIELNHLPNEPAISSPSPPLDPREERAGERRPFNTASANSMALRGRVPFPLALACRRIAPHATSYHLKPICHPAICMACIKQSLPLAQPLRGAARDANIFPRPTSAMSREIRRGAELCKMPGVRGTRR